MSSPSSVALLLGSSSRAQRAETQGWKDVPPTELKTAWPVMRLLKIRSGTLQQWKNSPAKRQSARLEGSASCRQEQRVPPTTVHKKARCSHRGNVVFRDAFRTLADRYATARGAGIDQRISLRQFCIVLHWIGPTGITSFFCNISPQ